MRVSRHGRSSGDPPVERRRPLRRQPTDSPSGAEPLLVYLLFEKNPHATRAGLTCKNVFGRGIELEWSEVTEVVFEVRREVRQRLEFPRPVARFLTAAGEYEIRWGGRKALVDLASLFPPEQRTVRDEFSS